MRVFVYVFNQNALDMILTSILKWSMFRKLLEPNVPLCSDVLDWSLSNHCIRCLLASLCLLHWYTIMMYDGDVLWCILARFWYWSISGSCILSFDMFKLWYIRTQSFCITPVGRFPKDPSLLWQLMFSAKQNLFCKTYNK